MAWRDIASRYSRSLLGPFWIAGAMAGTALSLSIVFGAIFGQPLNQVMPYIMAGLVAWQLVSLPLVEGPELFLNQAGTIKNHNFPYSLYAFQFITKAMVIAAHNAVVLIALLLAFQPPAWPTWQAIPGLLIVILFAFFFATPIGMAAARFRDLRFMLPQVSLLFFFMTPIFWRADDVHPGRSEILTYNPFYYVLSVLRDPIIGKDVPLHVWTAALGVMAVGAVAYIVSLAAFRRRLPFWI